MLKRTSRSKLFVPAIVSGVLMAAGASSGCGRPPETIDRELSETARETVFQKRIDVKNRSPAQPQSRTAVRKGKDRGR
jgi:hypothetical protein